MARFEGGLSDGWLGAFRARLRGSIQLRLAITLSLTILIVAGAAGTASFLSALHEAHKLQDSILYQIAGMAQEQRLSAVQILRLRKDDDSYIIIWPLDPDRPAYHVGKDGHEALSLPNDLNKKEQTMRLGHEAYRIIVRKSSAGRRVAVAQEIDFRDRLALSGALRTVAPFLALVPILVLIAILLIRGMFRPISTLSAEVDRRDEQDLRPLEDLAVPSEIRPFTHAINRLLVRVSRAMEIQRRFVADAAHELRSPMTALSLQAERLAQADLQPEARDRLKALRLGIERTRRLLDQLLTLARAQATDARKSATVSIRQTYRQVLEDLMPLADAKDIDIGLTGDQDVQVRVDGLGLATVIKNLVDNAIRYTPAGGRVDLSVTADATTVTLRIADSGPGIPPSERERVFEAFYRALGSGETGSGLGLAIVRAIADRLGATLQLDYTDAIRQSGLAVSVTIPRT